MKAVWESIEKVIINFDTNGGDPIDSQEIIKGSNLNNIPTPIKKGYAFVEWKLNDEMFNNMEINENITLKASWRKLTEDF